MARSGKNVTDQKWSKEDVVKLLASDDEWLSGVLREAGYVRVTTGLQQKELEAETGIPRKTLREWDQDGLKAVYRQRRKYYPVYDLVRFLADRLANRTNNKLATLNERIKEAKATRDEMELEKAVGSLIDRAEHEDQMEAMAIQIRASLLAMIPGLSQALAGKTPDQVRSELERSILWQLEQMASGRVALSAQQLAAVAAAVKRLKK